MAAASFPSRNCMSPAAGSSVRAQPARRRSATGIDAGTAHFYSSLDAPIREGSVRDNPKQLGDTVGGADGRYDLVDTKLSVASAIARLPYRERTALRLRLEGDLKQTEIAERMGCSQMQVSRLLRSAARQVREEMDPHVRIAP